MTETKHELGVTPDSSAIDLRAQTSDEKMALLKGAVGMVPVFGSLLGEIVGVVIPNQKIERLTIFAELLESKLKEVDTEVLRLKMRQEEFTDLFEDALRQASRALSDERREYIANILASSLTEEQISHAEEKKLLNLLDELNDPEIITLKWYALYGDERSRFLEQHAELLRLQPPVMSDPLPVIEKYALQKSYRAKLLEVGLLAPTFSSQNLRRGEMPEFDKETGTLKTNGFKVTRLGRTFLGYIDRANKALYFPDYASRGGIPDS